MEEAGPTILSSVTDGSVNVDPNLFSGFLSAIYAFTTSVGLKPIKQTETEDSKLVYSLRSHVLFVIAADKNEDDQVLEKHLIEIQNEFFLAFEGTIWKYFLKSPIDMLTFHPFKEYLDEIVIEKIPLEEREETIEKAFTKFLDKSINPEINAGEDL